MTQTCLFVVDNFETKLTTELYFTRIVDLDPFNCKLECKVGARVHSRQQKYYILSIYNSHISNMI